jgi:hypothetical protein
MKKKSTILSFIIIQFFSLSLFAQNIGINTQTPQARLHIYKGSSGYVGVYPHQDLIIESNDHTWINLLAPNNKEMGLLFGKPSNIASGGIVYDINNNMHFRTNGNVNRMFIGSNGNVGIGTSVPTQKLEVNGNIEVSGSYFYSTPKTYYYSIPSAAFTAQFSSDFIGKEYSGPASGFEGAAYMLTPDRTIVAPVNLPHEATITGVTIYYIDNNSGADLTVELSRRFHGTAKQIMCSLISSTGGTSATTSTITNPFIDNANYNYHIEVYSATWGVYIRGVFIAYTLSSAQ